VQFAGIQNLSVAAKGVRGLAYNADFAASVVSVLSPAIINASIISMGAPVKAGAPTSFAVDLGAPANATVRRITAELTVNSGPSEATDLAADVSVKEGQTTKKFEVGVAVAPPDGLQNVEIRLEGGDVLWSRPGVLAPGRYEIPDFTEQANAYLDKLPVSAADATLNFLLKSDVEGRASIRLSAVEWSLLQTQAWRNDLDATVRLDKSLELTFGDSRVIDLDPVTVPAGKTLQRQVLRLDAGGQFGPERLLGHIDPHAGDDFVLVNAGNSLAQRLRLDPVKVNAPLSCSGVAVYLAPPMGGEPATEFYAELQPDQDGLPASGPALAKANVKVDPLPQGEVRPWLRATFEAPVELEPGAHYWLVLRGVTGGGKVALRPTPTAAATDLVDCDRAAVNRGGKTWRLLPALRAGAMPPQALIALTYTPGLETQAAAVEIAVEGAMSGVRLDPAGSVRTIDLPLPEGDASALRLVVGAYAQGALTIANVIQEYRLA
jgi:hypothetical protein